MKCHSICVILPCFIYSLCVPIPLSLSFPLTVSQEAKSITPEGSHNSAVIPPRF